MRKFRNRVLLKANECSNSNNKRDIIVNKLSARHRDYMYRSINLNFHVFNFYFGGYPRVVCLRTCNDRIYEKQHLYVASTFQCK